MAKQDKTCKLCTKSAKKYAKVLGKEGFCMKHARIELSKESNGSQKV